MEQSSTSTRHFVIASVLVVISTIILNALLLWALPLPSQASAQAVNIDRLFNGHVLLIAFLFSLIVVFMIYALVVFRRREGDEGDGEHFEGNTRLEIAWTSAPMIFVIIFGAWGVLSYWNVTAVQENELVVNITGQQWNFVFEYEEGVIDGELVLPVNRPALMKMTSNDVMHAFWVPAFRVKQDIVPGQITEVRFTPTLEGEYRLRCAELCGLSHYSMLANVRVVSEDEYVAWIDEKLGQESPALVEQNTLIEEDNQVTNDVVALD
ncbi:MAG: cytochrome c oxidase subunit II [Chloroflexota bacterium]